MKTNSSITFSTSEIRWVEIRMVESGAWQVRMVRRIYSRDGRLLCYDSADEARKREGKTVDEMFREAFRC